jgi:hypothetical protein
MSFWNNPENNAVKTLFYVLLVAIAGYFAYTYVHNNALENTGAVGSVKVGPIVPTSRPDVTALFRAPSTAGTVWVERNGAYTDQTITVPVTRQKIGSYILHNDTKESLKFTNMLVGITTAGGASLSHLSNLSVSLNSIPTGATIPKPTATNSMMLSLTLPKSATLAIDLYADIGAAFADSIRTTVVTGGVGASTGKPYSIGPAVLGQNITGPIACKINSFTTSPVSSAATAVLTWSTSNCTSAAMGGPGVASHLLSGSITVGPLYANTTFKLVANGSAGGVVTATVDVLVKGILVSKNSAYPNQTFSRSTTHQKIGSFVVMNNSTESIKLSDIKVGFTAGVPMSNFTNFQLVVGGVSTPKMTPAASMTIPATTVIVGGAVVVVDLYADLGPVPSGNFMTSLQANGKGVTSGFLFNTGLAVSGQKITLK